MHLGDQQAFKFAQWLFVENDILKILRLYARIIETPAHCPMRQGGIVLDARKSLFGGGGDKFTITDKSGRRIVELRRNAENITAHP